LPRSAISPLGLTTDGSTKFKQKVENATLKNYSARSPPMANFKTSPQSLKWVLVILALLKTSVLESRAPGLFALAVFEYALFEAGFHHNFETATKFRNLDAA